MDNELYHHGIKGMKWGVRRTKAQLGYPTTTKKKTTKERVKSINERSRAKAKKIIREGREQAKIDKANAKAKARIEKAEAKIGKGKPKVDPPNNDQDKKVSTKPKKKSMNEMTDEELQSAINRLNLERTYKQLDAQVNPAPPKVQKGESFVKEFVNKSLKPAAVEAGKDVLKKFAIDRAEKALGLKSGTVEDPLKALKKEAEEIELKSKIADYKRKIDKSEEYFKDKERAKTEAEASAKAERDAKAKAEAQKQVDEYNQRESGTYSWVNTRKRDSKETSGETSSSSNISNLLGAGKEEVYGTVNDTSQSSNRTSSTNRFVNTTVEDISVEIVSTGKSYVRELSSTPIAGLLGSGKKEEDD